MGPNVAFTIEKVLEFKGVSAPILTPDSKIIEPCTMYAYLTEEVQRQFSHPEQEQIRKQGEISVQYALIGRRPNHGIIWLGEIDPKTRIFKCYDGARQGSAICKQDSNDVVNSIEFPLEQLEKLITLDEFLSIQDINVTKEYTPK